MAGIPATGQQRFALLLRRFHYVGVIIVAKLLGVAGFKRLVFAGVNVTEIASDVHVLVVANQQV